MLYFGAIVFIERLPLCTRVGCTIDVLEDSTVNAHTVQGAEAEVVRTNPRRGGQATSVANLPGLGGVIVRTGSSQPNRSADQYRAEKRNRQAG